MRLELSSEEARTLHDLLQAHLPALRREVAATDAHDLRHLLVQRQELCERLLAELAREGDVRPTP